MQTIKTLDYGVIPIAYNKQWLQDSILDTIEDNQLCFYEIRQTLNGYIVALFVA